MGRENYIAEYRVHHNRHFTPLSNARNFCQKFRKFSHQFCRTTITEASLILILLRTQIWRMDYGSNIWGKFGNTFRKNSIKLIVKHFLHFDHFRNTLGLLLFCVQNMLKNRLLLRSLNRMADMRINFSRLRKIQSSRDYLIFLEYHNDLCTLCANGISRIP